MILVFSPNKNTSGGNYYDIKWKKTKTALKYVPCGRFAIYDGYERVCG
jgi:hypothetical protein